MRLWPFGKREEKRDVQLSPYLQSLFRGNIAAAGVNVTPDMALRMMAVWACVRVISEDIASLPLPVYKRLSRGRDQARDYGLFELLHDQANPEQSAYSFRQTMTLHMLTYGNAYANIEVRNGRPAALWPIHPSRVTVRRNTETQALEYFVSASTYGVDVQVPLNRMMHIPGMSMDGTMGLSPIAYAREAIGMGIASEQFAAGFFANGAKPSLVLEHPGQLSPEAHERLRADFESIHVGLSNAQRVALLEEGMKASTLFVAPEDAQFLEQRQFTVIEIARLYRVHPHKIGVMEGTQTYSSVEQANIDHVVSTIRPWAVRWEQAIRKDLIPLEERGTYYAEHELTSLLRGDNAGRANFYRTMAGIGALSINEIRSFEGMNPIDGGDEYFLPLNMGTVEDVANPEPPVNVTPLKGAANG